MNEPTKPHSLKWILACAAGRLDKKPHSKSSKRKGNSNGQRR